MKALAISVHQRTLAYIREGGISAETRTITDTDELLDWVAGGFFQVLIVDMNASGLGSFFPRVLRKKGITIPIIGIGKGPDDVSWSEYRADFLEQGGDDLLKAPGNPRELLASIRAAARRFLGGILDIMTFTADGIELKINLARKQVLLNGEPVYLTGQEAVMMLTLATHVGKVVSKETLLSSMYLQDTDEAELKIVDVFICKIRKKLSILCPNAGRFIETIWGRGYTISESFQPRRLNVG